MQGRKEGKESTDLAHQKNMLIYVAQIQNIFSIAYIDAEHVF